MPNRSFAYSALANGIITFTSGRTFPGGGGTVTSVGSGAGLTGGPITASGSLSTIYVDGAGLAHTFLAVRSRVVQPKK
jgi:hypothetical protein